MRLAEWCRTVTRVTEFSFCTEEPLWILFLAYYSFGSAIAFRLEYVLFYQFYAKLTTFFGSKKVRYGSSLIRWHRNVWRKLSWKWCQGVKNEVKTSKSSYWCHARESFYTPHVRRHFLAPVWFTEISVGYAKCFVLVYANMPEIEISFIAKQNKSASRGAQLVPIGIPRICLYNLVPNLIYMYIIQQKGESFTHLLARP